MARFSIKTDNIIGLANDEKRLVRELAKCEDELAHILNNLNWDSKAKNQIKRKIEQNRQNLSKQVKMMNAMGEGLNSVARTYNDTEIRIVDGVSNNSSNLKDNQERNKRLIASDMRVKADSTKRIIVLDAMKASLIRTMLKARRTMEEMKRRIEKEKEQIEREKSKLKTYTTSDGKSFKVINNFDNSYYLDQTTTNFGNGGITACAASAAYNLNRLTGNDWGTGWEQRKDSKGNYIFRQSDGRVENWDAANIESIPNSSNISPEMQMKIMYEQLQQGNPVIANCYFDIYKDGVYQSSSNHYVVVVGIREGADPNNLTENDFLVLDSNVASVGGVRTLGYHNHLYNGNGASIKKIKG